MTDIIFCWTCQGDCRCDACDDDYLAIVERWVSIKQAELSMARHVFSGREISAVLVDPVGLKFPRHFYEYLLRYEPGQGLVPSSRNRAYIGRRVA